MALAILLQDFFQYNCGRFFYKRGTKTIVLTFFLNKLSEANRAFDNGVANRSVLRWSRSLLRSHVGSEVAISSHITAIIPHNVDWRITPGRHTVPERVLPPLRLLGHTR